MLVDMRVTGPSNQTGLNAHKADATRRDGRGRQQHPQDQRDQRPKPPEADQLDVHESKDGADTPPGPIAKIPPKADRRGLDLSA